MDKKRVVLILSVSIITSGVYLYPQTNSWYDQVATFFQKYIVMPLTRYTNNLFRAAQNTRVRLAALLRLSQPPIPKKKTLHVPVQRYIEFAVGGGFQRNDIKHISHVVSLKKYALFGLFDGDNKVEELIAQELHDNLTLDTTLETQNIEDVFEIIEEKLINSPEQGSSATGFITSLKKICIFNIGDSNTLLFHEQADRSIILTHSAQQHLLNNKNERKRLRQIANENNDILVSETSGRYGQDPIRHGLYSKDGEWLLEGLTTSRFLGYHDKKNRFGPKLQKTLAKPDITCLNLESGTYYVVMATKEILDTIPLDKFKKILSENRNPTSAEIALHIKENPISEDGNESDLTVVFKEYPKRSKYIIVKLIIK